MWNLMIRMTSMAKITSKVIKKYLQNDPPKGSQNHQVWSFYRCHDYVTILSRKHFHKFTEKSHPALPQRPELSSRCSLSTVFAIGQIVDFWQIWWKNVQNGLPKFCQKIAKRSLWHATGPHLAAHFVCSVLRHQIGSNLTPNRSNFDSKSTLNWWIPSGIQA